MNVNEFTECSRDTGNVYALTPTGCRPEGLSLLGEYLNNQTYQGKLSWIIVDDCDPATRIPKVRADIDVIVIRPTWRWHPGANTQIACMRAGLREIPDDAVLFILEDDDIYLPPYIETALRVIGRAELVGEIDSRYYNIATDHWKILKGRFHSSLASTACRGAALKLLKELCDGRLQKMLDINLWRQFAGEKRLMNTQNVVGIKGLPGRPGIGVGHRRSFGTRDIGNQLKKWAGEISENYVIFRGAS